LVGSDCGATLNTAFEEPKNSPLYVFKILPLIRTVLPLGYVAALSTSFKKRNIHNSIFLEGFKTILVLH